MFSVMTMVHLSAVERREIHKSELRAEILEAAREIFSREGYEGFTMRKLGKSMKYSPGNLYLYFKDREEIFDCLVEESFESLLKALPQPDRTSGEDPVNLLKRSLLTYVNFGLSHPNEYQFAFQLRPPAQARPHRRRAAYDSLILKVELCIAAKKFRTTEVELTAQGLWAAAHGITSLIIQRPAFPWAGRDQVIRRVIDSAVDALLVESPKGRPRRKAK